MFMVSVHTEHLALSKIHIVRVMRCGHQTMVSHLGSHSRCILSLMQMTNASHLGWGAASDGCPAQGIWREDSMEVSISGPVEGIYCQFIAIPFALDTLLSYLQVRDWLWAIL